MADRVGCVGIDALYMVRNLPVLRRRPRHLVRAESNTRLRLRRASSADYRGRYAARAMVCVSACGRSRALLSRLARVDNGFNG
jgi:hypothetical protein